MRELCSEQICNANVTFVLQCCYEHSFLWPTGAARLIFTAVFSLQLSPCQRRAGITVLCTCQLPFFFFFFPLSLLNEKFQTYFPPGRKWLCWYPSPLNILNASMANSRCHLPRTLLLNTVKFCKQPLILQIK